MKRQFNDGRVLVCKIPIQEKTRVEKRIKSFNDSVKIKVVHFIDTVLPAGNYAVKIETFPTKYFLENIENGEIVEMIGPRFDCKISRYMEKHKDNLFWLPNKKDLEKLNRLAPKKASTTR